MEFDAQAFRSKPPQDFFCAFLAGCGSPALSGIYRRTTRQGVARSRDLGIQRRHDEDRSAEIREFVEHGFPWSGLSKQRQSSGDYDDLKKPGWLPTAIVVNVLAPTDSRGGVSVHAKDFITVKASKTAVTELILPTGFSERTGRQQERRPLKS